MTTETVALIEPAAQLEDDFLAMLEEYLDQGESYDHGWSGHEPHNFRSYLRRLKRNRGGLDLLPDFVPYSTFWLVRGGVTILGDGRVRHHLNALLEQEGGHIGYRVRPSERRKGYGTLLCRLLLEKARALGIGDVLITCNTDNIGSARIIRKNGGQFHSEVPSPRTGKPVSRYWVPLQRP